MVEKLKVLAAWTKTTIANDVYPKIANMIQNITTSTSLDEIIAFGQIANDIKPNIPKIKALLSRLHALNESQAHSFGRLWYHIRFLIFCLWNWQSRDSWNAYNDL